MRIKHGEQSTGKENGTIMWDAGQVMRNFETILSLYLIQLDPLLKAYSTHLIFRSIWQRWMTWFSLGKWKRQHRSLSLIRQHERMTYLQQCWNSYQQTGSYFCALFSIMCFWKLLTWPANNQSSDNLQERWPTATNTNYRGISVVCALAKLYEKI